MNDNPLNSTNDLTSGRFVSLWVVLFPITYFAHITEEYLGGFVEQTAEFTGLVVPEIAFLTANAILWIGMLVVVTLVFYRRIGVTLIVVIGTVVVINSLLHIGSTLIFARYSAGVYTGVLLWLPLGIATLGRAYRLLPRNELKRGILLGVVAHALVPVFGFGFIIAFGGGWSGS